MTLLLLCHSCPPHHGQNILGELFLMLQNPPRSTNNLSTSKSKPWIRFLGLLGQGTKLDSWKQQKRERNLFFYSSEGPKTQNQVVGQDTFLPGPSKGEDIPRLSPTLSVSWLMTHHSSLCLRLHVLAFRVSLCLKSSCLTLCDPMDWSPPGSSVHGILQARMLEWVAMPMAIGFLPSKCYIFFKKQDS